MASISDRVLTKLLSQQCPYDELPSEIQSSFNNSSWSQKVLSHSYEHQLPCPSGCNIEETTYYTTLIDSLKSKYSLFPYHLAQLIFKNCQLSPFEYYISMLSDVVSLEISYDQIPNFTAADVERSTGIARNSFIDLMNTYKSAKPGLFRKKTVSRSLLPIEPLTPEFPSWTCLELGVIRVGDLDELSEAELNAITVLKQGTVPCSLFSKQVINSLRRRDFVLLSYPVASHDVFVVPALEGFVMNKLGQDWMEGLLYDLFANFNGIFTIETIAETLSLPLRTVSIGASLLARLGLIIKRGGVEQIEENSGNGQEKSTRLLILCDSFLSGVLMMGQFGSELKKYGQSLFEVGKLEYHVLPTVLTLLQSNLSEPPSEFDRHDVTRSRHHAQSLASLLSLLLTNKEIPFDFFRSDALLRLTESVRFRVVDSFYTHCTSISIHSTMPSLPRSLSNSAFPLPLNCQPFVRLWLIANAKCATFPVAFIPQGMVFNSVPSFLLRVKEQNSFDCQRLLIDIVSDNQSNSQYSGHGEFFQSCSSLTNFTGSGPGFSDSFFVDTTSSLTLISDLVVSNSLFISLLPNLGDFVIVDFPLPLIDSDLVLINDQDCNIFQRFVVVSESRVKENLTDSNDDEFSVLTRENLSFLIEFVENFVKDMKISFVFGFLRLIISHDLSQDAPFLIYPFDLSFSIPMYSTPLTSHLTSILSTNWDLLFPDIDSPQCCLAEKWAASFVDFVINNGGLVDSNSVVKATRLISTTKK
ncbi:hypothetical protein RCL1_004644 [Eukaryota sp. TZLM3-RCL]